MKRIIYQALARLWGDGRLSSWDEPTLAYIRSLGTDYLWLTGIPRHASGKSFVKGNPGCPYSISDWMDINPYLADNPERRMEEFDALVARVHASGLKLLIDYVPNHVARNYEGKIVHYDYCDADWTDTLKNDWNSPQTRDAMAEILRFWLGRGVDGFRCDMVELVPPEALGSLISDVKRSYPEALFVAEVYGKCNYGRYTDEVGFDLLYDKSGLYDSLRAISTGNLSARAITWNWQFLSGLQPRMLDFLENHDEQRVSSRFFLGSAAKAYAALAVSLLFNDASFMLYFGQEAGEAASESDNGRTSIFDITRPATVGRLYEAIHGAGSLLPQEEAVLERYRQMLRYAKIPAFSQGKCWDLCYCNLSSEGFDADRHFAFLRYDDSEAYLVFCNFSDSPVPRVSIAFPEELMGITRCGGAVVTDTPARDAQILKLPSVR